MNKRLFPLLLALTATLFSFAQEKRALLIAIDNYEAPPTYKPSGTGRSLFRNLDGCVNDARSIQSIVISKFQFDAAKVDTLYDAAANRAGILKKMNELLI